MTPLGRSPLRVSVFRQHNDLYPADLSRQFQFVHRIAEWQIRFRRESKAQFIASHVTTVRMNRSELIERLARQHSQLQIKDTELGVKLILDVLSATLSTGGRIEIRGFGSFALNAYSTQTGQ